MLGLLVVFASVKYKSAFSLLESEFFLNKTATNLKGRSCLYTSKPNFSNLTNVAAV